MNNKYLHIFGLSLIIICIGVVMVISATSGFYWSKSYPLSAGLAAFHEVQVDGTAQLVLYSPPGSNFDLYAMHSPGGPGSCPSESTIMMQAEQSTAGMEADSLILGPGLWCIVVYAESGSGTCKLEASGGDTGYYGTEGGTEVPDSGTWYSEDIPGFEEPGPGDGESGCAPFKTLQYEGFFQSPESTGGVVGVEHIGWIREGNHSPGTEGRTPVESIQYSKGDTYSFEVGGPRSDIEIILLGMCHMTIPNHILTVSETQALIHQDCGINSYLSVFKDCNPQSGTCDSIVRSGNYSPKNSYVRITEPAIGSTYYVTPEGLITGDEQGYQLIIRSFQCYL